jgi:uncharacterized tellurite resistance protein B-like protein
LSLHYWVKQRTKSSPDTCQSLFAGIEFLRKFNCELAIELKKLSPKFINPNPFTMNITEILNLFSQGKGTAKSHMKNLIEMAAVDGNFEDIEYDLLKTIAKRNSISESALKEIKQNPGGVKFEIPADKKQKFHQLYDLVHMMSVDKSIHDEELKLCNLFAIKFGYKREQVRELIETIRANIEHGQNHDETMKRVDWLLN